MSPLLGLHVIAVVAPRVVRPVAPSTGGADAVMILGFFAAFFTIVVLMYQQELRTRLPLLVMGLIALSVDGFLQGTWAIGFSLAALSAAEFRRWYKNKSGQNFLESDQSARPASTLGSESRVERMFGSL